MKIAVLGTGRMATTLAAAFLDAGHTVVLGSRDPAAHPDLPATVADHATAIEGSDLVVSAVRGAAALEALTPLAGALAGHVLLDIGNAVDERFELLHPSSSLGERLQAALPGGRVVKSLNTVAGAVGTNPAVLPEPTTVFLSGDDADAKRVVGGLLADLGWAPTQQIDLGGIRTARGPEHYFLLFAALLQGLGDARFNIRLVH